jgi:hypothetical protein
MLKNCGMLFRRMFLHPGQRQLPDLGLLLRTGVESRYARCRRSSS